MNADSESNSLRPRNKPITLADIEEMKRRGYEPATLEKAREDNELGLAAREVCAEIEAAFAGVTLGDGIVARALMEYWVEVA